MTWNFTRSNSVRSDCITDENVQSITRVVNFWSQVINLMTVQWSVLNARPLRDHLDPVHDVPP